MKCADCHFYDQTDNKKKIGLCEIVMPAWITREELTTKKANIVGANECCDFGKPKQEDDEL